MPSVLRSRVALFALMGAFLIPITVSGLRGLTHILTCQDKVETPFTIFVPETGPPLVSSSTRIERGQEEGLCGGLLLVLKAKGGNDSVEMIVLITNNTQDPWRGTVQLALEGQTSVKLPIDIGSIPSGETAKDTVQISLGSGTTEIGGSLLIGP